MGLPVTLLDQLDAVADWGLLATDADLVVTGWNRWLEQRSGMTAEEVRGRPLFDVFPELPARRLDRYYRQALSGQTVLLSQRLHRYIIPLPPAVGGAGAERMQQAGRIVPLVDGPAVRGTLTLIEDVTERVAHEAELRAHAGRQAALAAVARAALAGGDVSALAADVVGHLAAVAGVDFAELLELRPDGGAWVPLAGTGWSAPPAPAFDPASAPRTLPVRAGDAEAAVEEVAADPRFAADEFLRSHGVASGLVVRVPGRDGRPFGLLGVYTRTRRRFAADEVQFVRAVADVLGVAAERKRLEGELRLRVDELGEADRRKDEFLAMLAHELRNPLAPIRNALQVLRFRGTADPIVERMGQVMDRQVGQMTRLVDDLLDVSRITRGKVALRKERVELSAVVLRAVEAAQPLIDARRHEFATALPPGPVYLDADPTRLAQALGNLLTNAAKYTEEGGRIWLTVLREGAHAVVTVRDTGIGISADMLPRVFDLFTQVDSTLDRAQGGLGIGLTLVRSLVEMHGGSVRAASAGPGKGSEFVVTLPTAPDGAPGPAAEAAPAAAPVKPRAILIVDDNTDSAESLAVLLRLAGHHVRTAYDGPSALRDVETHRPEVVLLDIGLPGMDGYAVARGLRARPGFRDVMLIAMTGYGQDEDRRQARAAGFDHHLVKPVDPAQLARLLV